MFDNLHFKSLFLPGPIASDNVTFNLKHHNLVLPDAMPDIDGITHNVQNASFCVSGDVQIFLRPPIIPFAKEKLFYMENFSIFSVDNNFFTNRSNYSSYQIIYTYEGEGVLTYQEKQYFLTKGDGFFMNCMCPYSYKTHGKFWRHGVIHINGPLLPSIWKEYTQHGSPVFSEPLSGNYQSHLEKLLQIYDTAQLYRDFLASGHINLMLADLLVNISGTTNSQVPENLQYLKKYMENHFTDPLTLDFLADFSGISKYHLSREFKKYIGFSPNDYLISLRLDFACTLLESTTIPVYKISSMAGIPDSNHFSNLFKKRFGTTPGQYRTSHSS